MSTYIKNQSLLLIWNRINNHPLKFIFIREELSAQAYWYFKSIDGMYYSSNKFSFENRLLDEIKMKVNKNWNKKEGYFPESWNEAPMFPENPINMIICCGE